MTERYRPEGLEDFRSSDTVIVMHNEPTSELDVNKTITEQINAGATKAIEYWSEAKTPFGEVTKVLKEVVSNNPEYLEQLKSWSEELKDPKNNRKVLFFSQSTLDPMTQMRDIAADWVVRDFSNEPQGTDYLGGLQARFDRLSDRKLVEDKVDELTKNIHLNVNLPAKTIFKAGLVVTLLTTGCAPIIGSGGVETQATSTPALTQTIEAPNFTPTIPEQYTAVVPTEAATPVPTDVATDVPTVEATKAEVMSLPENESKFFKPDFFVKTTMKYTTKNGEVVEFPLTIGFLPSFSKRDKFPIPSFKLDNLSMLSDMGILWMKAGLQNYKKFNPGNDNLSLDDYAKLVQSGGGLIHTAGLKESDAKNQNEVIQPDLTFSPLKGEVVIFAQEGLPLRLSNQSMYIAVNADGALVVAEQLLSSDVVAEQIDAAQKSEKITPQTLLNIDAGRELARALLAADGGVSKCMVEASKTMYFNGGDECKYEFGTDFETLQNEFTENVVKGKWLASPNQLFSLDLSNPQFPK